MLHELILNYNKKVRIITVKDYIIDLKPAIWIKSIFMVLIGLETTRFGIGIGRVNTNIYFGSVIFSLISVSGMLVVLILKDKQKVDQNRRFDYTKTVSIFSVSFFGVAFGLALYHTIIYNLETLNLYLLAFIISISFSFGLIYGASLNYTLIPIIIYLFFGATFLLQISKDLINDCKHIERDNREGYKSIATTVGEEKARKLSLIFDILVVLLIVIPIIPGFPNILGQVLYTIFSIITIIFLSTAAFLTFRMNIEKKYYRIVKILLRSGMFLIFTTFILANF